MLFTELGQQSSAEAFDRCFMCHAVAVRVRPLLTMGY